MVSQQEINEAVAEHNRARDAAPGVRRPHLQWDNQLAHDAQEWANHLAATEQFQHAGAKGEGENLFMQMGGGPQPLKKGVQSWNEEKKNYHGEKIGQGNFSGYGHYTQIIWPATTHVGMATAFSKSGHQVIVARYKPQGNFVGKTAYEN
ncbi:CAP domain-containing protein [Xylogone sp. PMI_703]|nr:CAP domain-containing protein [Xylogone sp. PMI_703]